MFMDALMPAVPAIGILIALASLQNSSAAWWCINTTTVLQHGVVQDAAVQQS